MSEEIFGKRRPLLPKLEPLFDAAHHVDDVVREMRRQVNASDDFCIALEEVITKGDRPDFGAIALVDAAVLRLRNEITSASAYCAALEKLTSELHVPNILDEPFEKPPRMLTNPIKIDKLTN